MRVVPAGAAEVDAAGSEATGADAAHSYAAGADAAGADAAGADAADEAAGALLGGRVVVVPTDTVYGLAALPASDDAVRAVYRLKQRPAGLHLPLLAAGMDDVRTLGVKITGEAEALAARWWPGPLTMAFGFDEGESRPGWLAGRTEVAVRVPDHELLRRILVRTGPLFVTSANPHGSPTPLTASSVVAALQGRGADDAVALVVDGGRLTEVPSTLVNVASGRRPVVEREGAIPWSALEAVLPAARRVR
jgi:L-threonylcarbamoyladenylate synthase